jgi:acyl-CoA synthetase (AMP-forming)/AMP-acid ligase II
MEGNKAVSGNIYSFLQSIAIENPERILITVGKDSISGADFLRESQRISDALYSAGVEPGVKVAMILPNSVQWYCTFWSIVKLGGIPVPLDPQAGEWEMVQLLNHAECTYCSTCILRRNSCASNVVYDENTFNQMDIFWYGFLLAAAS